MNSPQWVAAGYGVAASALDFSSGSPCTYTLIEQHLYGASRLGNYQNGNTVYRGTSITIFNLYAVSKNLLPPTAGVLFTLLTIRCSEKKTKSQSADSTQTTTIQSSDTAMTVQRETFGKLPDDHEAYLFTLTNDTTVEVTTYGAIITYAS